MDIEYCDILLDNGEIAKVEIPLDHCDDFYETLEYAMKRRDWLCFSSWKGCRCEYMGVSIDRLNMSKVIGTI